MSSLVARFASAKTWRAFAFPVVTLLVGAISPALAQNSSTDQNAVPNTNTAAPQPSAIQQIQQLNWIAGPNALHMTGNSTFYIPQGYEMLAPPDSRKFIQLQGNITSDADNHDYILQSQNTNSNWFSVLVYENVGHVPDGDNIKADELLANELTNMQAGNVVRKQHGLATMNLTGWAIKPNYNQQTHRVEWAYNFQNSDGTSTVNWNTRILGRTGDMKVIVVDDPNALAADIPDFNNAISGFSFDPKRQYSDYKQGDKLAKYGLMGLIAGGAAAAAVKTGLLAALLALVAASGKAVIVGVIALLVGIRAFFVKVFRRKSNNI